MRKVYLFILYCVTAGCVIGGLAIHTIGLAIRAGKAISFNFFSSDSSSGRVSSDIGADTYTALKLDIDAAEVKIEEGDAFNVNWDGASSGEPKVEKKGDTLKITQNNGFHFLPSFNGKDTLTVTIPAGTELGSLDAELDAGNLTISGIAAGKTSLDLDMGNISLRDSEFSTLTVDADMGNIVFDSISAKSGSMYADMGNIQGKYLDGFTSFEMDADMGNIEVDLRQESSDLSLNLSADLGDVRVDGEKSGKFKSNSGSARFSASTNLGNIRLDTSK